MKRELSPHEKMLRTRVQINREEHERYRKLKEWMEARAKEIRLAPSRVRTAFFCDLCDADWEGLGVKQIRMPPRRMWFAYYQGYCPAGHPCVRRISDKLADPFYFKSYVLRKEQAKHADEFLPHWHPRFKQIYPERYREFVERMPRLE